MGLLSRTATRINVRPNEVDVEAVLRLIGQGARKRVYADASTPGEVVVDMYPHPPTEEFYRFARQAHQEGLPIAKHLPNPDMPSPSHAGARSEMWGHGNDDMMRFRTERLQENDRHVRMGRENDEFYVSGMAPDDPQRASLLEAAKAMDEHLAKRVPRSSYFYDMHRGNFMRRPDGTLVINDPVAAIALMGGGGALGNGLLSRTRQRAGA